MRVAFRMAAFISVDLRPKRFFVAQVPAYDTTIETSDAGGYRSRADPLREQLSAESALRRAAC